MQCVVMYLWWVAPETYANQHCCILNILGKNIHSESVLVMGYESCKLLQSMLMLEVLFSVPRC